MDIRWHTCISFLAGDDFHEHTAIIAGPIANQMNEDKPGTQENKQSAFKNKTALDDVAISRGNSVGNLDHLKIILSSGLVYLKKNKNVFFKTILFYLQAI